LKWAGFLLHFAVLYILKRIPVGHDFIIVS
jgi:hypothetical protein